MGAKKFFGSKQLRRAFNRRNAALDEVMNSDNATKTKPASRVSFNDRMRNKLKKIKGKFNGKS